MSARASLFEDIDSMVPERFTAHLADDVRMRFGNADPVSGRAAGMSSSWSSSGCPSRRWSRADHHRLVLANFLASWLVSTRKAKLMTVLNSPMAVE